MIDKHKYIVFYDEETGLESFKIFPALHVHSDFRHLKPISAGFVMLVVEDGVALYHCYGKSVSLGLNSRPEDSNLLNRNQ